MNITIREKDGGYQAIVSYKQNGKWKQKSKQGFSTKKDAKTWANEIQFKLTEDRKDNIDTSDMTVGKALEIYLDYKKHSIKFTTYATLKSQVKNFKDIEHLVIANIKPIEITTFIKNKQEKTGKGYNVLQKALRSFFNFCIKELKLIRDNPCIYKKVKSKDKRIMYISDELYNEILNTITDERKKIFIKIAYNAGMRKSEILALKLSDIQDNIITVSKQRYNGIITKLKSDNGYRRIPINNSLYNEIKSIKVISIDGFIFPKYLKIREALVQFNVSPHCFRHTFATNLVAKGINLKVASELLGDDFGTFINTYVQSSTAEREKVFKEIINS